MIVYTCPKCGSDLQEIVLTSYPPQSKMYCTNCNWSHIETDKVYKIPYKVENESVHAVNVQPIPDQETQNNILIKKTLGYTLPD